RRFDNLGNRVSDVHTMNIFVLKLILAPVILGGASLAGRRWGHAISGWLVGLPLTSGPVIFFLSLSHDTSFVSSTVLGTLSGGFSGCILSRVRVAGDAIQMAHRAGRQYAGLFWHRGGDAEFCR